MNVSTENEQLYERFQLLVNGPALFNAVVTAMEFDVFAFLSAHPNAGFEDIQKFVDIPAHQLRVLMHAVCATGLVRKDGSRYANSVVAEDLLTSHAPDAWRHILLGWKEIYYPAFADLTTALREGTNTALAAYPGTGTTLYERLAGNQRLEAVLHASMSAFTLRTIGGLVDGADLSDVRHLLDVGGGDAATARHLADRYSSLRITIFDLPSVVGLAEAGDPAGAGERIRYHGGDMFTDDFPRDVDAVLFSHVLEVFEAPGIVRLLAKAFEVLPSGGKLFVYGFNASDDESSGIFSARLSLYLNALATGTGMAYPAQDYERWLRQVGCTGVRTVGGLPFEHGLTMGTKP